MTATAAAPQTRLDRATWRPLHSKILLALGIGWALDSFEVQIIGSVLTPLADQFGLLGPDGATRPGVVSTIWVVWFAGLMIGATTFGWLADRFGRKRLFVATLVLYSIATVLSAFAPTFAVFLVFRFVTALGVGGEYSAVTSAVSEFMPTRRRGAATATTMNFWSIGGIVAGLVGILFLSDFVARDLVVGDLDVAGWRLCLLAGALAAVYGLYARRVIPESPRWLASQGRQAEADAIIMRLTGLPDDGSDFVGTPNTNSLAAQLGELWRSWRARLVYGMTLEFVGSAAYYGLFTFLGAYVLTADQVDVSAGTVPVFYLIGNIGALAGGAAVAAVVDRLGRTPVVIVAYAGATGAVLLLAAAAASKSPALTLVTFTIAVFCATCCWISTYATFSELFPTPLRATGVGVSVAAGRLGGMVGVVGLAYTVDSLGLVSAFVVLAVFTAIGVVAGLVWRARGTETARLPLDEVAPPVVATT